MNFASLIINHNIMKNKNLILTLAVFLCPILCHISFASERPITNEGTLIIIRNKPVNPSERPRTSEYIPFYAELFELGVLLVADTDWGDATVTLSSLEGDYYQTTFDMADGSILLPVNGDAGDSYTLSIEISGLEFEGDFIL